MRSICLGLLLLFLIAAGALLRFPRADWENGISREMSHYVEKKTGFTLTIGSVKSDLFRRSLEFKDLEWKDPREFSGLPTLKISSLSLEGIGYSLFQASFYVKKIDLKILELFYRRNAAGGSQRKDLGSLFPAKEKNRREARFLNNRWIIESLFFELKWVTIIDLREGREKRNFVDIKHVFKNLQSYKELLLPLAYEIGVYWNSPLVEGRLIKKRGTSWEDRFCQEKRQKPLEKGSHYRKKELKRAEPFEGKRVE